MRQYKPTRNGGMEVGYCALPHVRLLLHGPSVFARYVKVFEYSKGRKKLTNKNVSGIGFPE